MGGRWLCSVFSNALSLGRKRNGTKILGGLSPLATPSQNQVPAFPYGLKLHYTNHLPPNFREFFYIGDENVSPAQNLAKGGGGEGVR